MGGLERLKDIRERTEPRHSKTASVKRCKTNRKISRGSFAEVQTKTGSSDGVPIEVGANDTSQGRPLLRTHRAGESAQ